MARLGHRAQTRPRAHRRRPQTTVGHGCGDGAGVWDGRAERGRLPGGGRARPARVDRQRKSGARSSSGRADERHDTARATATTPPVVGPRTWSSTTRKPPSSTRRAGSASRPHGGATSGSTVATVSTGGPTAGRNLAAEYDDSGGASRFFPTFRYEAKAGSAQRPRHEDTAHPTVKPLALMQWLVRLVTPPGGTVLEPFAGCRHHSRGVRHRGIQVHRHRTRRDVPAAHQGATDQADTGRPQLRRGDGMSPDDPRHGQPRRHLRAHTRPTCGARTLPALPRRSGATANSGRERDHPQRTTPHRTHHRIPPPDRSPASPRLVHHAHRQRARHHRRRASDTDRLPGHLRHQRARYEPTRGTLRAPQHDRRHTTHSPTDAA